ncbi:MAG: zinc-ribbon domain-containing protein [Planctomycetaceae bacterium]|nr:zinc-ribbon domain-containing protein [Planctomycetaceae bacterium]
MPEKKRKKTPRERRQERDERKEAERRREAEARLCQRLTKPLHLGGYTIPAGAILADHNEQAPNNSYSAPLFYEDREFKCRDCGSEEVWTAEQQKWYYEIVKGPIQAFAVRCRECRKKERERKRQSFLPKGNQPEE